MYLSAKRNVGFGLFFFALFFGQFFVLGAYYSESTDTFWINNLLLQGIDDFEVFYVFISPPLSYLYSLFPTIPFSNLLLYSLLLVLGVWLSMHLKNWWDIGLVYLVLFSEPFLMLDFTCVSILVVLLSVVLFLELRTNIRYLLLGFIVLAACMRYSSVIYSGCILLPYLVYVFYSKGLKKQVLTVLGVLVLIVGVLTGYFNFNEEVAVFREVNGLRAKIVDYDRSVIESGEANIDYLERGLYQDEPVDGFEDVLLDFSVDRTISKVIFLLKRLFTTYSLYIVVIFLLLLSNKSKFHWVHFCYVVLFLLVLCVCFKMPNRLLLPTLSIFPLLLFFDKSKAKYSVYLLSFCALLFSVRLVSKSFKLKDQQVVNETKMKRSDASKLYRSYGLNTDLMFLNPVSNYNDVYLSKTIPLGGWVGLLPQVNKINNDSRVLVLKKDKEVFEDWLGSSLENIESCPNCYRIKKGTSE